MLSIAPGLAVVLRDDRDRVLLHRRRVGSGWAPVSGHLQPGESLLAGLHREVAEETGLRMGAVRVVGVYSDPGFQVVTFPDGRQMQFVTTLFAATVMDAGALRGNDEATVWAWFAADGLPDPLLPYARRWLDDALAEHERWILS